jgi:hypothetical protein
MAIDTMGYHLVIGNYRVTCEKCMEFFLSVIRFASLNGYVLIGIFSILIGIDVLQLELKSQFVEEYPAIIQFWNDGQLARDIFTLDRVGYGLVWGGILFILSLPLSMSYFMRVATIFTFTIPLGYFLFSLIQFSILRPGSTPQFNRTIWIFLLLLVTGYVLNTVAASVLRGENQILREHIIQTTGKKNEQ